MSVCTIYEGKIPGKVGNKLNDVTWSHCQMDMVNCALPPGKMPLIPFVLRSWTSFSAH